MKRIICILVCCFLVTISFTQEEITTEVSKANEHFNKQDYTLALELYHSFLEKDSTQNTILEQAGLSAFRLGDFKLAKQFFQQLEVNVDSSEVAFKNLAFLYEAEENIPKAIKYYLRLIKKYPENPIFHRKLGQQYQKSRLLLDAFPLFIKAYTLNSKDNYTIRALANIFMNNKQFTTADTILKNALAYDSLNIQNTLLYARDRRRYLREQVHLSK